MPLEYLLLETDAPDQPDSGHPRAAQRTGAAGARAGDDRGIARRGRRRSSPPRPRGTPSGCSGLPKRARPAGLAPSSASASTAASSALPTAANANAPVMCVAAPRPGAAIELQRRIGRPAAAARRTRCRRPADTARSPANTPPARRSSGRRSCGKLNSPRSFLRISASIASCSVRDRSRTRTWVGSVRPPAEPTVISGSLRRRHHAISSTLLRKLSQASSTRSKSRSSNVVEVGRRSGSAATGSTSICGLIARHAFGHRLDLVAAVLARRCAGSWRLVFDTQRSSASISVRWPTPRARQRFRRPRARRRPGRPRRRGACRGAPPRPRHRAGRCRRNVPANPVAYRAF